MTDFGKRPDGRADAGTASLWDLHYATCAIRHGGPCDCPASEHEPAERLHSHVRTMLDLLRCLKEDEQVAEALTHLEARLAVVHTSRAPKWSYEDRKAVRVLVEFVRASRGDQAAPVLAAPSTRATGEASGEGNDPGTGAAADLAASESSAGVSPLPGGGETP